MSAVIKLWLIEERPLARLYSKTDPKNPHRSKDEIWIPRSIVEHTTKRGDVHEVTLPDWFIQKEGL